MMLYADFCVVLFSESLGGAIQAELDQPKEKQKPTTFLFEPEH